MRSLLLSGILGLASLGFLAGPGVSSADARPVRGRAVRPYYQGARTYNRYPPRYYRGYYRTPGYGYYYNNRYNYNRLYYTRPYTYGRYNYYPGYRSFYIYPGVFYRY